MASTAVDGRRRGPPAIYFPNGTQLGPAAADRGDEQLSSFEKGRAVMNPPIESATPSTDPIQTPVFGAAYQEVLGEIRAVPDGDVVFINIDIPTAVTTALGTLPEIRAARSQLAELAHFD